MWTSNLVALVFAPGLAAYVLLLVLLEARERQAAAGETKGLLRSLWTRETFHTLLAPATGALRSGWG